MSTADLPADAAAFGRTEMSPAAGATVSDRRDRRRLVTGAAIAWLPIAAAVVVLSGLVYVTVQQSLRTGADDPQIQMAGDLAAQLSGGAEPAALLGTAKVDLATSLAPYSVVFDASGAAVASNGALDGAVPLPPPGVLRAARQHRNQLTWEPRSGVRSAIVVEPYQSATRSGTVLVGRSLTEVEKREAALTQMVGASLVAGLGVTGVACLASAWLRRRLPVAG